MLLTLASWAADGFWSHLLLRFGTGVASAWVLVMITSLSQQVANAHNRQRLGALVFAGPGLGIALTRPVLLNAHRLRECGAVSDLLSAAIRVDLVCKNVDVLGVDVGTDVREHLGNSRNLGRRYKVTADDIVAAIRTRGRQRVPDHVKAELLTELRSSIIKQ